MEQRALRSGGLPLGRRVPAGTVRWYLVRCHEGRETRSCADVARMVSGEVLQECFVPRVESGRAKGSLVPLFAGHFIAVCADAPALAKTLSALSVPVELVGQVGRGYAPIAREAQEFLASVMDAGHVVRTSSATLGRGGLHVVSGPLVGQERRVRELDAQRHCARVTVGGADGDSFVIEMPIDVRVDSETAGQAAGTFGMAASAVTPSAPRKYSGTSIPMGRRTPRGRLRWYLVECPEGAESEMCAAVREVVPTGVLADAYVPRTERIKKVHGEWTKPVTSLVPGCFAVATADSAALRVALERTGLPVRLVGQGSSFQPLDDDAWGLVQSFMDGTRTIRESRGEIVGDQLHVWSGPLAGRESVVNRYLRRQSLAFVDLGSDQAGEHTLLVPLAILARR